MKLDPLYPARAALCLTSAGLTAASRSSLSLTMLMPPLEAVPKQGVVEEEVMGR